MDLDQRVEHLKQQIQTIVAHQGFFAALTELHRRIWEWEHEGFEGEDGPQPALIERLKDLKDFCRELWDQALLDSKKTKQESS